MTIVAAMKRAFPAQWKRSIKLAMGFQDMEFRLSVMKRAGFNCSGAIDAGAFSGEWAQMLQRVWDAPVLMVEPQTAQQTTLRALVAGGHGKLMLEAVALGAASYEAQLLLEETNSRLSEAKELSETGKPAQSVTVETLDQVMARYEDFHPNLLKLDVQGAELSALDGATSSLERFEVIVLEVSFIRIGAVPLIEEVIEYMSRRNFRLYDMLPMYYRPLDGALWQADAIFVNVASPLVAVSTWN